MNAAGVAACAETRELRELLAENLTELLGSYDGDELAEAMWQAALGVIDRATARTRAWAWWRARPRDELARLREQLEHALRLAGIAADLQTARNQAEWDEGALARDLAEQAARRARRAQTLPAERARLAKAARRSRNGAGAPAEVSAVADQGNGKV